MTIEPVRAAIYCRISSDREGGGLGVERQEKDCRDLAARLGWDVATVFVDNDISAYGGKPRPGYESLLEAIQSRAVEALLVWHTDRLHRSPKELEHFIEVVDTAQLKIETVKAGTLDLSTDSGKLIARMLGAAARFESDHKSSRVRRKARELAETGRVGGGGYRPFGYEHDRVTIREDEAELIREAADAILNQGMTIHGVCRDWNDAGLLTVRGSRWTPLVVRRMLMSARISGQREHHGVITARAVWPGIISVEDGDRLRELLRDPSRTTNQLGNARRYLLSGIAYCGIEGCGDRLKARPQGDHQRSYVCANIGRAHLRMHAESVEVYVTEAAMDYLDEFVNLVAAVRERSEDTEAASLWADLQNYRRRLENVQRAFYVAEELPEEAYRRLTAELEADIDRITTALSRVQRDAVVLNLPAGSALARERWEASGLAWRRNLLTTLIQRVTVGPGVKGRNRFDPDRVTITWRRPD